MMRLPTLSDGRRLPVPLPRLVDFTHEDREAKGLRVFDEGTPAPPVQFTALEMVSMHRAQLLHARRGGGKTTLAQDIAAALSGGADDLARLCSPAVRNPEGTVLPQEWDAGRPKVILAEGGEGQAAITRAEALPALLILDGLEKEPDPGGFITAAMRWLGRVPDARLLILCESIALEGIRLHPDLRAHALLPLPMAERRAALDPLGAVDPVTEQWVEPGLWSVALAQGRAVTLRQAASLPDGGDWLQEVRDADTLLTLPPEEVAGRAVRDPLRWQGPLRLLAVELQLDEGAPLLQALAATGELPLLLAASEMAAPGAAKTLAEGIAQAVAGGGAPPAMRRRAGEALARMGDPRDLEALAEVPAGTYLMGGDIHPNSAPAHEVLLPAFRIGVYPVTCGAYGRFVSETGREWVSATGRLPHRASHPATDLTWHDARAYCAWLSQRWRAEGRIGPEDTVRLPTEREWEAAARGATGLLYPWGESWAAEHANDEETGYNDTCAVGLFPEGRSPFGCLDMAGQVWEWCTTLWGDDMTAPGFRFPWAEDGREDLDAPPRIRRVLRGGCFSSGRLKANGVYRGSLEPGGYWRGNGFRIVVA